LHFAAAAARGRAAGRGQAEGSKKSFFSAPASACGEWLAIPRKAWCRRSRIGFWVVVLGGRRREAPSARIQGQGEESQADESTARDGTSTRECFTFTSFRRATRVRVRTEESEEERALSFCEESHCMHACNFMHISLVHI